MSDLPGPAGLAEALHPHTGALVSVKPTERGNLSDLTALVVGENGEWFVKAVRNRPGGRLESLVREGLINPHVQPISPAVLWQAETPEWMTLGFEIVRGHHADLAPGSPDLPAVVDILNRIANLSLPGVAKEWPETRWDMYCTAEDAALLRGDSLLYTDIQPDNLMIGDRTAWAVDWAWPTRGAACIDPALLVVQLVAAGHTAEAAEEWATGCLGWTGADPHVIDVFTAANLRMWQQRADRNPDESWLKAMADASQAWADHRGVATGS